MMDQALPQITINTDSGRPYVSVIDNGAVIGIQLHDYTSRVVVHLDKKCIPELIRALKKMNPKNSRGKEIKSELGYSRVGLNNV
jgi:hypothetical protein